MNDGKINVELDYKDFYAILELTGKDPDNEFLMGIHKRFLERVFRLAASIKGTTTDWVPADQIAWAIPDWSARVFELRGRAASADPITRKKIQAIKAIRMVSNMGLKEAKDYIDVLVEDSWRALHIKIFLNGAGVSELRQDLGYEWELRSVGFVENDRP